MSCDCLFISAGYCALAYFVYKIGLAVYNILWPYIIGTPVDLLALAGAKWAGRILFLLFIYHITQTILSIFQLIKVVKLELLFGPCTVLCSFGDDRVAKTFDILVITGATDGIGKAYAFELAKKGFNIFLVSRTQSKLDEVQKEIREKYSKVDVKTFAFDFCNGSVEAYKPLREALNGVEVGVLINNVGMSYEYPERLHKVEGGVERLGAIATINTLPPTIVSFAPGNKWLHEDT
ncbi:unnamed protein product [Strongylus vulgaris]|uniref:Uncharacterized protein n=1 Tax=Strongylus vulgaris TaxID=40348 RepID=A0A3P7JDN0_STRVU|nr:unnamed protein product [Strongylus vulgaris]